MSKKNITDIIVSGKAKDKVLLLTEDVAKRKSGQPPLLSEEDFQALLASVKRPQEVRLYNQFRKIEKQVTTALYVLNQSRLIYRMHISDLRGYVLLWESYQRAEEFANLVLHETTSAQERERIARKAADSVSFLLSDLEIGPEGYVAFKVEEPTSAATKQKVSAGNSEPKLMTAMLGVKSQAIIEIARTLGYAHALLDYMKDRGFKIKTYEEKVQAVIDDVLADKAIWQKYSSRRKNALAAIGNQSEEEERQGHFAVYPDPQEIEMDKAAYNHFMKNVVGYE